MIIKVESINHIGKFGQFHNPNTISFERYSLIYGENGQGKTTLAHILRSLCTGESRFISERKSVGAKTDPSIIIELDTHVANYNNQQWDSRYPDIEIFDTTYVNENLFSGYYIDLDKKRKLYRFVIGDKGVQLSARIDKLTEEIKEINETKRALEAKIVAAIHSNMSVDEFVALSQLDEVDKQIEESILEVSALREKEQITNRNLLASVVLPIFPKGDFEQILRKQLSDITSQSTLKVKNHIAQCMDDKGEVWINQGQSYIQNDICPFCGQPLIVNELVKTYEVYFSEAYGDLKSEILQFAKLIEGLFSHEVIENIVEVIGFNNTLAEFWSDYVQYAYPEIDVTEIRIAYTKIKTTAEEMLRQKLGIPLDVILLNDDIEKTISDFLLIKHKIETYNDEINRINSKISERKILTESKNLAEVQIRLNKLQINKSRFETEMSEICKQYNDLNDNKQKKEREKLIAKRDLDNFTVNILEQFEDKLNEYFDKFMTGFRIEKEKKPSYSGGKASISYSIIINGEKIELGDSDTVGEPSFATSLSEGDKNTFAFAYFMSRLDLIGDIELKNKIVIFDDPISSLDKHRRSRTQEAINRVAKIAKQVIILSHDTHFLKDVWDGAGRPKECSFKITHDGLGKSYLVSWDIQKETQGAYFISYEMLTEYLVRGSASSDREKREIAKCIRELMEGYYKIRFPKDFNSKKSMGAGFIRDITGSKSSEPLYSLLPSLAEITAINTYSAKYHHDENPGADTEPILDLELTDFVKRTLKLLYS